MLRLDRKEKDRGRRAGYCRTEQDRTGQAGEIRTGQAMKGQSVASMFGIN